MKLKLAVQKRFTSGAAMIKRKSLKYEGDLAGCEVFVL
jgi:hypothetical protein